MINDVFQTPLPSPENQLWPGDRYTWRSEELPAWVGQVTNAVAEIQWVVNQGGGDQGWVELVSRVMLFGAGKEVFVGDFPDRLELDVEGYPIRLRTDTAEPQFIAISLAGVLIDEAHMRDPENPARFRLQLVDKEENLYGPPPEAIHQVEGSLRGWVSILSDERPFLVLEAGVLELNALDFADFPPIKLELDLELRLDRRFDLSPPSSSVSPSAWISTAVPVIAVKRSPRVLKYQCVFFSNGQEKSGEGVHAQQLAAVQAIWGGACLEFQQAKSPHLVNNPALFASNDIGAITGSYTPPVGIIPLFFVHHALGGGGATPLPWGSSLTRVVVSDMTSGRNPVTEVSSTNPNLLAHEMGHVLGGVHPDQLPSGVLWRPQGAPNVMKASGVSYEPNSPCNPLSNCIDASNTAASFKGMTVANASCSLQASGC